MKPQESTARLPILIADDDADLRDILEALFARQGFPVLLCDDAEGVLKHIDANTELSAIIMDLLLPFADGFDLVKQIRQTPNYEHTPMVILSDLTSEEDVIEAFTLRVNDVISKPFQPRELKARVLRWLEHEPLPSFNWKV